jgi:hypothetical protein
MNNESVVCLSFEEYNLYCCNETHFPMHLNFIVGVLYEEKLPKNLLLDDSFTMYECCSEIIETLYLFCFLIDLFRFNLLPYIH